MTNVADAKTVIEKLLGKTVSNAKLLEIADRSLEHAGKDTSGTDEEKAGLYLALAKQLLKVYYQQGLVKKDTETTREAAEATAETDFT